MRQKEYDMNDTADQLTLFSVMHNSDEFKNQQKNDVHEGYTCQLYVDGASRNNPGIAGAGIYIMRNGIPLYQTGYFLGIKTNNQAEYLAFLLGLFSLKKWYNTSDHISIFSDSLLLVKQLQGLYKVRNDLLKPLHHLALSMMRDMHISINHIMREDNMHADKMANHGIETQKPMPHSFLKMLKEYDVAI